jgi:hypothetical protein
MREDINDFDVMDRLMTIFESSFPIDSVVYLVIVTESDLNGNVDSFVSRARSRIIGLSAHVIREQPLESLLLMTLCRHHVVINSTLGFWGLSITLLSWFNSLL